jgi:hypothetical protein
MNASERASCRSLVIDSPVCRLKMRFLWASNQQLLDAAKGVAAEKF